MAADIFDYIIVGAGAAGSILANRLSEDSSATVCLLEAGPSDWHPFLHIPAGFIKVLFNPAFTWQFATEPAPNTNGRSIPVPVGRTLGGSTAINGLVYNRGLPSDYDQWAAAGNRGWSFAEVLPYFKRTERKVGAGDDRFRGRKGEMPITDLDWIHPICEAFIAGAEAAGIPRNPDYNGAYQEGVGYYQRNILHGWRQTTARTFLRPARKRGNLEVRTNAHTTAVMFENKRATGVRYARSGAPGNVREVLARREVILSAGAVNTAKLLQLSGLGAAALLQSIGVNIVHELPGVGANLRDHYSIRLVGKVRDSITMNELSRGLRLQGQIARWMLRHPNILALSPSLVHWFWKSREGLAEPDLQGVFTPASYREGYIGVLDAFPGMTCGVWQHRPYSTGHVRARSSNPFENPVVQPNFLTDERDQQVLIGGMKIARQLLRTSQLAPYFVEEALPGPAVNSDDEWLDFARGYGASCYHVMGTARMGPASDPSAVVDDELRVRGIAGLRVADASIMPNMPSANICAATMMIAEKAADMIRGRPAPVPEVVSAASLDAAAARAAVSGRRKVPV